MKKIFRRIYKALNETSRLEQRVIFLNYFLVTSDGEFKPERFKKICMIEASAGLANEIERFPERERYVTKIFLTYKTGLPILHHVKKEILIKIKIHGWPDL